MRAVRQYISRISNRVNQNLESVRRFLDRRRLMNITTVVNGQTHENDVEPRLLLVQYLREVLRLTGHPYRL